MKYLFFPILICFALNINAQKSPNIQKVDSLNLAIDSMEEDSLTRIEIMPRFPGCEDQIGSEEEKQKCALNLMLQYVYKNIKYPPEARENGVEGMVIIKYVVDLDGSLTDVEIVKDPGGGLGEAGLAVINLMNEEHIRWVPGSINGTPAKVQFHLPIKFKLESNKERRQKRKQGKKNR